MSYLDSYYLACRFKNVMLKRCACGLASFGDLCEVCLKGRLISLGANPLALSLLSDSLASKSGEITKIKALFKVNCQVRDSSHRSQILLNFMLMNHEEQEKSAANINHTEELLKEIKTYTAIAAIDKELQNEKR